MQSDRCPCSGSPKNSYNEPALPHVCWTFPCFPICRCTHTAPENQQQCFRPFYFNNINCGYRGTSGVQEILTLTELQTCALSFPYRFFCWNYCNLCLPIILALNECLLHDWFEDQQYHVGCTWNERNGCLNKYFCCAKEAEIISEFACR